MLKAGKLSHLIKELKQNNGKDQAKVAKKGEAAGKDKPLAILMVQSGRKIAKQRITQTFSSSFLSSLIPETSDLFLPNPKGKRGTTGPMLFEAEVGDEEHNNFPHDNLCFVMIAFSYNGIIGMQVVRRNQSNPVHNPRNVEVPSDRQNGHRRKIQVAIHPEYPEQTIAIFYTPLKLEKEGRKKLCGLLRQNLDIFAWKPSDITGVPRHIAEHRLNVREGCFLFKTKVNGANTQEQKVSICEEGEKASINGRYHERDFKDLNKACPKDGYPLPEIDWKVESLCGYPFKCFLDAYKGYHQIKMAKENRKDSDSITAQGIFYYSKLLFRLKNAGAAYQRLVDKAFQKQIGRNLEAYVDDLVIKSCTEQEVIQDVEETFKTLRKINMKLNPKKCTFGMKEGVFLGYKVNSDGLMVYPDKVEAVLSLPSPKCLKDVQRLNGKLASLNSRNGLPANERVDSRIAYDGRATRERRINHLLGSSKRGHQCRPDDGKGREANTHLFRQLSTSMSKNQLHSNGKASTCSNQPIKQMLSNPEVTGRLLKWSFELGEHDIQYRPRTSDIVHEDGSSCTYGSSGAGLILTNPEGMEFTYALRFRFDATNNEAEYEALIAGLKIAEQMGVENLQVNVDSRLVANQVNITYVAKETDMIRYLEKVKTLTSSFKAFLIKQVPRNENKKADALSKIASTSFAHLSKQVLVEELKEKSISAAEVLAVVEEEGDTWMTPIFKYLSDGTLPAEGKKARAVKRKSWRFSIINGILYKKSFLGPWLRCVGPLQANYVLREIHEGSCSMHAGTRSVVAKALRIGYYWPTMHEDARKLIQACQDCQVHKPVPRNPQQKLSPITSPWPFYKWGIDIAGPFPKGLGKVKFLIVDIDYFTKWIEAKPVATTTGSQIKKIVWDNIVCRFGLPGEITSDNGKQFQDNPFKDWCEKLYIRQHFASVKHPQTNGLVERANRSLGEGIKAILDEMSKNWMEEPPHVLWAHHTMIKSSKGDTPFSLTYRT
ncbi:reverse transcriptase domain-containing protein, partial [Tanacetum coccineum]